MCVFPGSHPDHISAAAVYLLCMTGISPTPLITHDAHTAYWCFEGDSRIFVQTTLPPGAFPLQPTNLALKHNDSDSEKPTSCMPMEEGSDSGSGSGSDDEEGESEDSGEEDSASRLVQHTSASTPLRSAKATASQAPHTPAGITQGGILLLSGKITAPSTHLSPPPTATRNNSQLYASKPSNIQHTWRIYGSMLEIWMLVEALDERGVREKDLKSKLRAQFGMNKGGGSGESYSSSGSEYIGRKIRRTFGRVSE